MRYKNKVFRLEGKVQHYAWGGYDFLPALLHQPNSAHQPFAEYWMGAHSQAGSSLQLANNEWVSLEQFIAADPEGVLGPTVAGKFGHLPYLLKILDVRDMLSIQVHPNKKNAEIAYAEENRRTIPLDSALRNYKDDNHKPELMVSLSDFWLLHGFKPRQELANTLERIPELSFLLPVFLQDGYEGLYRKVMYMDPNEVDSVLRPLLARFRSSYAHGQLEKTDETFWALRAADTFMKDGIIDRGIFSIYFFNLVRLRPGEAIYQAAGVPHAYLEGQNIEIMANSDNVLRAGLTAKHVDVPELMKQVTFDATRPEIILARKSAGKTEIFDSPAPDFALRMIRLSGGDEINVVSDSAEIFFVLEGGVTVHENQDHSFQRAKGEAFESIHRAAFRMIATEASIICHAAPGVSN